VFLRHRRLEGRRADRHAALAEDVFARACDRGDDGGDARIEALRACVERLGTRSRALVRLFYGEGRSRTEVAGLLGIRETGVKTALQRVRQSLRDCMERNGR